MFILPHNIQAKHAEILMNMSLEVFIRQRSSNFIQYLRSSKLVGTLCFAGMSARILQILQRSNSKSFWYKIWRTLVIERHFIHSGLLSGLSSRRRARKLIILVIIEMGAKLSSSKKWWTMQNMEFYLNWRRSWFSNTSWFGRLLHLYSRESITVSLLSWHHTSASTGWVIRPLVFTPSSIIPLFQSAACFMTQHKKFNGDSGKINSVAGFIGGLSYIFCPNYYFFTLAMTLSLQVCLEGELLKLFIWNIMFRISYHWKN